MAKKSEHIKQIKTLHGALLLMFLYFFQINTIAQTDPLYTQNKLNALAINPAYAGSHDVFSFLLLSRKQWDGFRGAPITNVFSAHTPMGTTDASWGLSVIHDNIKPTTKLQLFADYAYRFHVSEKTKLALGLKGGFGQISVNYNRLEKTPGQIDPAYNEAILHKTLPNFGVGLFLSHPAYYVGLSVPRLIENSYSNVQTGNAIFEGKETRIYVGTAGAVFSISQKIKLKPSFISRLSQATAITSDLSLDLLYNEKLWLGTMLRPGSAWGATLQIQATQQLCIGYSYEMGTNLLQYYQGGSHEIMVLYQLKYSKSGVTSPRYF